MWNHQARIIHHDLVVQNNVHIENPWPKPNPGPKTWVDPVAMWHNKQSTLGFADGHAEMHRWIDEYFIEWNLLAMAPGTVSFNFSLTPPADEREDIEYMARGFPYKSLN